MYSAESAKQLSTEAVHKSLAHLEARILEACKKGEFSISHSEKFTAVQSAALQDLGYSVTPTTISWVNL